MNALLHHHSLCEKVYLLFNEVITSSNRLPGDISAVEPPDPIPNSEVKRSCADGSVGFPCESRSLPGSFPIEPSA